MWLKVSPTNHNTKVVARFYLEIVEEVAGMLYQWLIFATMIYTMIYFYRSSTIFEIRLWN